MSASVPVPPASGPEERTALVAGDDLHRVDAFVTALRRAGFSVRCVLGGAAITGVRLVRETPFNLVVVVLPSAPAGDLLDAVRGEGSRCRQAAVLLVLAPDLPAGVDGPGPEQAWALAAKAHRVLPAECPPEELLGVAEALLHPAPRMAVRAAARIALPPGGNPLFVKVEDLSSTGILLTAGEPIPIGTLFEFEIVIRSLAEPICGYGQVVREAGSRGPGEHTLAARFLSFDGEGGHLLERLISAERAAAEAKQWMVPETPVAAPPAAVDLAEVGAVEIRSDDDLTQRRQELAELSRFLDGLLRQGLGPRIRNADWYVTGARLGIESLSAFSKVLAAVKGRARIGQVSRQLADMEEVRRGLGEFALPTQSVAGRVQSLLAIRQPLERLLRALAVVGTSGEYQAPFRPRGLVADVVHDIQRLLRARQAFGRIPALMEELQHPRFLVSKSALRRRAGEIALECSPFAVELGLKGEDRLLTRAGRQETTAAAAREVRRLDTWLSGVHDAIYGDALRRRATDDLESDLGEANVVAVLNETLSGGTEALVRTYGAYRHALELTGTDPRLLDRVGALAESIAVAEGRGSSAGADDLY